MDTREILQIKIHQFSGQIFQSINQSIYFRGIQNTKAFNSSSMPTANSLEEQA